MAKKGKGHASNGQGIASWLSSVLALIVGFSSDVARAQEAQYAPKGQKWARFAELEMMDYTGYMPSFTGLDPPSFDIKRVVRGWGSKAAGIALKKASSYLIKTAKVKSLIPRIKGF